MDIFYVHYVFSERRKYKVKTAVIGSRNLIIEDIGKYIPENTTELLSGGARGVDTCVRIYAKERGIKLTEILPEYEKYGRAAPIKRNVGIIEKADTVVALWNGKSKGTEFVINYCKKHNKTIKIYVIKEKGEE